MAILPNTVTVEGYLQNVLRDGVSPDYVLEFTVVDTFSSESVVLLSQSETVALDSDGFFSISLYPSSVVGGVYRAQVLDGSTVVESFTFELPPTPQTQQFADLIGTTIQPNFLDTSVRRIASYIASDSTLLGLFAGGFRPQGDWTAQGVYSYLDVVTFDGSSWVNLVRTPNTGTTPGTDPLVWQLVASKGDTGVGAGQGINTAYNEATWAGDSVQPPTRQAVGNEFEVLRDLANSKAPQDNPTFTGIVTVPTSSTIGDVAASTEFVSDNYAPLVDASLTGSPTATLAQTSNRSSRIATTRFVQDTRPYESSLYANIVGVLTNATVQLTPVQNAFGTGLTPGFSETTGAVGAGRISTINNRFTMLEPGTYLLSGQTRVQRASGTNDVNLFGVYISRDGSSTIEQLLRVSPDTAVSAGGFWMWSWSWVFNVSAAQAGTTGAEIFVAVGDIRANNNTGTVQTKTDIRVVQLNRRIYT